MSLTTSTIPAVPPAISCSIPSFVLVFKFSTLAIFMFHRNSPKTFQLIFEISRKVKLLINQFIPLGFTK